MSRTDLRALPGGRPASALVPGRSHMSNLRAQHPAPATTLVYLELAMQDVQLLLNAIGVQGVPQALKAVAERIAVQLHPSFLAPAGDDAPAHGYPRPGGA